LQAEIRVEPHPETQLLALRVSSGAYNFSSWGGKDVLAASRFLKRCSGKTLTVREKLARASAVLILLSFSASLALGESCLTSNDIDDATRTALTSTATRYLNLVAKGDVATLRQSLIPSIAVDFSVVETVV
jgi:hypothetical protein